MPSNTPVKQALLPVTADGVNAKNEWLTFQSWWKRQRPGDQVPSPASLIFDAWMQSARHRQSSSNAAGVGVDVEAIARALFVFQHQGDIAAPGQVWDAPEKGLHPLYWVQKMEHNHPHYRAMARAALASLSTPTAEPTPTPDRIGKDAVREALADHFPTGLRSQYARTAGGIPVSGGGIAVECKCGWSTVATDDDEARQQWADHVVTLSSTPAHPVDETERLIEARHLLQYARPLVGIARSMSDGGTADSARLLCQRIDEFLTDSRAALQHKGEVSRG